VDVVAVWVEWGGGWIVLGLGVGERRGGVVIVGVLVIRVGVELVEVLLALLGASHIPALVVELEVD